MKNMLKHLAGLMLALLFSCTGGKTIEITVTNPSGVARPAEVVVVDYKALQKAFSGLQLEPDIQISDENGSLLPTQFDDINGDQKWDELVFIADFAHAGPVIIRWDDNAIGANDPFHDDRCDLIGSFIHNDLFQMRDAFTFARFFFLTERTAVTMRVEKMNSAWHGWLYRRAAIVTRQRNRSVGRAVVGTILS